jgi:hypothetical protein
MSETLNFLQTLFGGYGASDALRLEIRALRPAWQPRDEQASAFAARRWFPLQPRPMEVAAQTAQIWSQTLDVYFGVLPRNGDSGKGKDVPHAAILWADIDAGDGTPQDCLALLKARVQQERVPAPSLLVCSGGGLHCYWLLREPVPLPDDDARFHFKRLLQRLSLTLGGSAPSAHADPSCCDVARVLRVAGTRNLKRRDEPRPVELWHEDFVALYDFSEWDASLPPLPPPKLAKPAPVRCDDLDRYRALWRWANEPYPEGKRHQDLASAGAWLIRDCKLPREIAEEMLRQKAAVSTVRRIVTERELEAILRWA